MRLIQARLRPSEHTVPNHQNLRPQRIPLARVRQLAPEEDEVDLCPAPFRSVQQRSVTNPFWTMALCDPTGLQPSLAIVIASFGWGTDAPIVLDYRQEGGPQVMGLSWHFEGQNRWIPVAPSFAEFVQVLGLWELPPFPPRTTAKPN